MLLKRTDRLFELAATGNPWVVALRNTLLLPTLLRYAGMRKRMFRFISQLGIHYRGSPVVVEHGRWQGGPRAGERAPDASLRRGDEAVTLFEAVRGPEHHLLVFAGTAGNADSSGELAKTMPFACGVVIIGRDAEPHHKYLADADGQAHKLYGIPANGGVYLIRPDGYVGARAPLTDASSVLARYASTF